jgi:hypothetical protein
MRGIPEASRRWRTARERDRDRGSEEGISGTQGIEFLHLTWAAMAPRSFRLVDSPGPGGIVLDEGGPASIVGRVVHGGLLTCE